MEVRVQNKKATPLSGINPVIAEIGERLQSQPNLLRIVGRPRKAVLT
jgi:hypothetical protein